MDFVVSDESVNSLGLRIITEGIDVSRFQKNPVMLYDHDDCNRLPIGKWSELKKADGTMTATANFDDQDDFAKQIKGKAEQKIIQMASIGIIPIEWSDDPKLMLPGQDGPTITKSILREISITPFGSNHNAFRMYDKDGNMLNLAEATKMFNKNDKKDTNMSQTNLKMLLTTGLDLNDDMPDNELVKHCLQLSQQVQNVTQERDSLKNELQDLKKKDEVKLKEQLIANAVSDKKITEKQKQAYMELSYEQAKNIIDAIEKPVNLKDYTNQDGNSGNDKRKDWTFKDWSQNDPDGLEQMKLNDTDKYKELFKAEYNKEPNL